MSDKNQPGNIAPLTPIVVCGNCETTQKRLEIARQRLAILEKLFDAVDEYCVTSMESHIPVDESFWRDVVTAWERAR
jgi:hypothetical protein